KKVLVAGCLPKISRELLENQNSAMVSPDTIEEIPKALRELEKGEKPVYIEKNSNKKNKSKLEMKKVTRKGITAIIPISDGCLGNCSYCGVKNARGNLKSYSEKQIIEETRKLVEKGKKQIYITGQDTGCYGKDKGNTEISQLIQKMTEIKGNFKLRVGMMNPEHLKEHKKQRRLIESIKNPKVYKFLHIPVQSGSNKVLKDMNRRYTSEEFKEIIGNFEEEIENLNLATDIIVGYPTEQEEEFQETINLIKEIKPDITNISRFYPRPNTKAEKLEPHTSQILKKRSKKLSEITRKISKNKNKSYLDQELEVLITKQRRDKIIGRAQNYKKIQVEGNKCKLPEKGETVKVKIIDVGSRGLRGKMIEEI
ncbi:MAG: tRNA (N(6)-L-threonylcarbamoyladenosine(37)-C(2))-methylthiotransferase, partial [archaeon]